MRVMIHIAVLTALPMEKATLLEKIAGRCCGDRVRSLRRPPCLLQEKKKSIVGSTISMCQRHTRLRRLFHQPRYCIHQPGNAIIPHAVENVPQALQQMPLGMIPKSRPPREQNKKTIIRGLKPIGSKNDTKNARRKTTRRHPKVPHRRIKRHPPDAAGPSLSSTQSKT